MAGYTPILSELKAAKLVLDHTDYPEMKKAAILNRHFRRRTGFSLLDGKGLPKELRELDTEQFFRHVKGLRNGGGGVQATFDFSL